MREKGSREKGKEEMGNGEGKEKKEWGRKRD